MAYIFVQMFVHPWKKLHILLKATPWQQVIYFFNKNFMQMLMHIRVTL